MPATVERLAGLPIIHVIYRSTVHLDDMQSVFERSVKLISPDDHVIYRIVEIIDIESNFAEVLQLAHLGASDTPGSTADERFHLVLVGHDRWTKLYIQLMSQKQFGHRAIPCFVSFDQALAYVQTELEKP